MYPARHAARHFPADMCYWQVLLIVVTGIIGHLPTALANDRPLIFEVDVQPVLVNKCGKCHRADQRKGELDLSSIEGLRSGGESGESVIGSSLSESLLWEFVESGEMPPEGEPPLDESESELIRRWIDLGAKTNSVAASTKPALTQHSILPIVLLRCTACHGAQHQRGGLDLRTVAGMHAGGNSGPALVVGDPDRSRMIQRVESHACPPSDQLLKFFVRRPPKSEIEILRQWITDGAPTVEMPPDVATTQPDPLVSHADRQHWAFQPIRRRHKGFTIDDFIGARLHEHGLDFSPPASREILIRRVYFDLIGMPPSVHELHRWRESPSPAWYSQMVDQLLSSPDYGQRWGRYWLDLAGYADSEGGVSSDPLRPVAWKYRDYVIAAFNDDKPYDQFLIEQLAGDELLDHANADMITTEMVQNLVATGFLRLGVDETGSRTMNFVPERLKVVADAINIVGSGLMGLTLECARCHGHKYDPIPQRDYYRFKAVFQGALDEYDWLSFQTRKLVLATLEHQQEIARTNPPLEKRIKRLSSHRERFVKSIQRGLLRHFYPDQSEQDNEQTIRALRIADNSRTLVERTLVEKLQQAELTSETEQPESVRQARSELHRIDREIDQLSRQLVPPASIRALWDRGRPSPTYVLRRGEHDNPGDLVGPGVPSVLTDGQTPFRVEPPFPHGTPKTGRRLAFARWLTNPNHPLTSRVMVNRIWYHHFGRGLASELDNFGVQVEPPSHPDLLDSLAIEFVDHGWSVKSVHRKILHSRTYQQSSVVRRDQEQRDPDNRLWSRMELRRLDAEAIRDSLLVIADCLVRMPGGIPDTVSVDREGMVSVNPMADGGWRRSVYSQYRRTQIPSLMDTFDYPNMGPNCVRRNISNISPQPLMLMNNERIRLLAADFAARIQRVSIGDPTNVVDFVYQIALSRLPNAQERKLGTETLRELEIAWDGDSGRALETYCHTIINSAAFLYVD